MVLQKWQAKMLRRTHTGTNALLNFYRHKLLINTCHLKDLTVWARKRIIEPEQSWVLLGDQDLKFVTKYIISEAPSAPEHQQLVIEVGVVKQRGWYPPPATDSEVIRCFGPKQWDNTTQKKKSSSFFPETTIIFSGANSVLQVNNKGYSEFENSIRARLWRYPPFKYIVIPLYHY